MLEQFIAPHDKALSTDGIGPVEPITATKRRGLKNWFGCINNYLETQFFNLIEEFFALSQPDHTVGFSKPVIKR